MTPFYFGSTERRLFGLYAPARGSAGGTRAVLLCHPWGDEYLCAHRSMRQLGNLLCAAGHHVLRFDYFGTGDSSGEMADATLQGWGEDIETAMDELKDTTGATRVTLIGLRLGAALAAHAAIARPKEIDQLVLWDPVVSGPEYLEDILRTEAAQERSGGQVRARTAQGGGREIMGFPLTDALAEEIRAIDLVKQVTSFPARTRVIASAALQSHESLRAELDRHARADVYMEHVASLFAWLQHQALGAGVVPARVLEHIAQWLK